MFLKTKNQKTKKPKNQKTKKQKTKKQKNKKPKKIDYVYFLFILDILVIKYG
jgi:hypothetical protein